MKTLEKLIKQRNQQKSFKILDNRISTSMFEDMLTELYKYFKDQDKLDDEAYLVNYIHSVLESLFPEEKFTKEEIETHLVYDMLLSRTQLLEEEFPAYVIGVFSERLDKYLE